MKIKQTKITKFARGRECTMHSPGCNNNPETSVWCHSNMQIHGKGRGIKAKEPFGFIGCSGCNYWYDDSKASREEKEKYFWPAFSRTLHILMENKLVGVDSTDYVEQVIIGSFDDGTIEDIVRMIQENVPDAYRLT